MTLAAPPTQTSPSLTARVWRFGADVNTDQIVPGRFAPYMTSEAELRKAPFIEARPEFAPTVQPGDLIVAGNNFGCGSSREYAPQALKLVEVGAIIAPSFARIFFRNALNLGGALLKLARGRVGADGDVVGFERVAGGALKLGDGLVEVGLRL